MSSYSELIKNFEKVRAYMREFYVYGFKSREDYKKKSARSYDDERRRIESWLGDHMRFVRTPEGKSMFLSIDSRTSDHNPLYKAWKAKSFTDGDITFHFILFDILHTPQVALSIPELMAQMDECYLAAFQAPMFFDESTVRKKLQEYCREGMILREKQGRRVLYRRAADIPLPNMEAALDFYSEVAPCGVIGSFLLDKEAPHKSTFTFKHHYITGAIDSGVLAALFSAMHAKCAITALYLKRGTDEPERLRIIPLRVFLSVQTGRQYLLAYQAEYNCIKTFRIDHLSQVKLEESTPRFDELRAQLDTLQTHMWGVNTPHSRRAAEQLERVSFTLRISAGEAHILRRLEREKRIGTIEKLDDTTYRFTADVYDAGELTPWIRTFLGRIERLNISDCAVRKRWNEDLATMYRMYGIEEEADT